MINKYETNYSGPFPKSINQDYPDHTYDAVTCLVTGELKRVIQDRYLQKFGYTKKTYLLKFPDAPLKSFAASDAYRQAAMNDNGRRSANMRQLNLTNSEFQETRKQKCKEFFESERSIDCRKSASAKAKIQHQNGLADYVRNYFKTDYIGSNDQMARKQRMQGTNNIIYLPGVIEKGKETYINNHNSGYHATRKRQFKNYNLKYQSSYEYHFLEYCELWGSIHLIAQPNALRDNIYPRRYYLPDYIFDNKYVVEIKSWYIEKKQLALNPNVTTEKQELVERLGYSWLYILDKNYTEFDSIFNLTFVQAE